MIQHTSESRQISCYLNLKVPKWQVDICVYCILNRTLFSLSFVKEHLYSDLCSDMQEFCTQVKQAGCYWLTKGKKVQLHNMEFYVNVLCLFYTVKTLTKQAVTCSIKNWYRTNFTIAHAWKIVTCINYLAEDLVGIWLHVVWSLQACIAEELNMAPNERECVTQYVVNRCKGIYLYVVVLIYVWSCLFLCGRAYLCVVVLVYVWSCLFMYGHACISSDLIANLVNYPRKLFW